MNQNILCPKCAEQTKNRYPSNTPYPGEHVKFVDGKALINYVCDKCNIKIPHSTDCTCFSIWADYGGKPYYEWENDFITIK